MGKCYKGTDLPHIYIFPRSKETLFIKPEIGQSNPYVNPPDVYYQDCLGTYEDSTMNVLPKMMNIQTGKETTMKEIENRIYVDLWDKRICESDGQYKLEIKRKITIGFLKEGSNNIYHSYQFFKPPLLFQCPTGETKLVVTLDSKNTGDSIYIEGVASGYKFTSINSTKNCAYIPINKMSQEYMVECTLHVFCYEKNINKEKDREIEITAHLVHAEKGIDEEIGSKSRLKMSLYRYPQKKEDDNNDPFASLKNKDKDKDKDIFIMPRYCQDNNYAVHIKQLQIYSNQVLARHKGIKDDQAYGSFNFVKEDGVYTNQLGINYGMSIKAFQETKKLDLSSKNYSLEYDFSSFGQSSGLVKFISSNYGIDENIVRKIVIDRNFIYGKERQTEIKDIQGIKNIHDKIVRRFRERIMLHAQKYVDFPYRWMPRPSKNYNKHYHRGNLTVESGMNLIVYNHKTAGSVVQVGTVGETTSNYLPENAIITFVKEPDDVCNNSNVTSRYKVSSIRINGQDYPAQGVNGWFVSLTYENKKKCKDIDNQQNLCNYMIEINDNSIDKEYLDYYKKHNGVPYYIGDPDEKMYGGKEIRYNTFENLLNVQNIENWYSYANASKPNSPTSYASDPNYLKGIGLDCSGFIMNCLLDTTYDDDLNNKTFLNKKSGNFYPQNENAYKIGSDRTRLIPLYDDENNDNRELLVQAGDLIYSQVKKNEIGVRHIALCTISELNKIPDLDIHLTEGQKNKKYFTIIHNYGGTGIKLNNSENLWEGGFFCKTLKGPFKHWGLNIDNIEGKDHSLVGRIYLWY